LEEVGGGDSGRLEARASAARQLALHELRILSIAPGEKLVVCARLGHAPTVDDENAISAYTHPALA
jgi:hypothetical protein